MDRPFPWRVLEDADDAVPSGPVASPQSGATAPAPADPPDPRRGGRRRLAGLASLAAATVAAVVAVAVVLVGSSSPTLVLPGDGARPLAVSRLLAGGTPGVSPGDASPGNVGAGALIVIDVAGAVRRPGVYRLDSGARVADAVEAAGGYGPRVDVEAASRLNLAAPLHDGEQVRVPSRDDSPAPSSPAPAAPGGRDPSSGSLVDINTATAATLDTLPGIGPATAAKIIAAREEAPFATVDELRSRGVVGEATFAKVRDLVTVGR